MGRLIEQLSSQHNLEVVLTLNSASNLNGSGIVEESFRGVDVAIEFSSPHAALANLNRLADLRIPVVTGTTGWLNELPEVSRRFEQNATGLVWSPNFSIGIAIFRRLAGLAAQLFEDQKQYGAWAWEIHHDAKIDAPSGTLLQLVEIMKDHGYARRIDTSSSRAGRHPGTHEIGFDSESDTVTLRHVARSRDGFAHGALKAAGWIIGRSGVHTFENVLFGEDRRSAIPDNK